MEEMVIILKNGSCPCCGHSQFVVHESNSNMYLTNIDGNVVDSKQLHYKAIGICTNCNKVYNMMPTSYGFIPMTPLRELLYNMKHFEKVEKEDKNPMLKG